MIERNDFIAKTAAKIAAVSDDYTGRLYHTADNCVTVGIRLADELEKQIPDIFKKS